jgi:hypothetical protein
MDMHMESTVSAQGAITVSKDASTKMKIWHQPTYQPAPLQLFEGGH